MTSRLKVTEIADPTNGNTAISIDSSGVPSTEKYFHSKGHPCFLYEKVTSHSSAAEILVFNTKKIDTHDAMNTTSGKYIIPVAGIWEFNFSIMTLNDSSSGHFYVQVYQNSTDRYRLYSYKQASTHERVTGAGLLLDCAVGDEVYLYNATGATITLYTSGNRYTTFSGKLIG